MLFVDATLLLVLFGIPHTGIPRVQDFLVRQAIADPDPTIQAVTFDYRRGYFRPLTQVEERQLTMEVAIWPPVETAKTETLRAALRLIREYPAIGRRFDRAAAARATKCQSGLAFTVAKLIVRAYRYGYALVDFNRLRGRHGSAVDLASGVLLLAQPDAFEVPTLTGILSALDRPAFICHDLIPAQHPHYVDEEIQVSKFVGSLTCLVRVGAQAICISEFTRQTLAAFVEKGRFANIDIGRFYLPSILFETAAASGRTSRLEPDQPFVLYCATVEVRKNHILLARIWKRAIDDGVDLPKLVCVGRWGWRVEELKAYLNAHPELVGKVDFIGHVSDSELIDLYRSALFGVMPSRDEGWGWGASECLDFGLPVVVSTSPALLEAVRGLMPAIDPDDEDAWYAKIRHLAEEAGARERLIQRIRTDYAPVTTETSWTAIKTALHINESAG